MGEVYALVSGKGGTGKTSVCAGLAAALAEDHKRVLCIDCDVGLRNLDISLGMTDNGNLSFQDVCQHGYSLSNAPCSSYYPDLHFLTAPVNQRAEEIDTDAFLVLLERARQEYDYILLDAPAGVGYGFRLVTAAADRFLLVTGSSPAAVRDAARVGELLELEGKERVRLVVNRVDKSMLAAVCTNIDDVMDNAGLPLAGVVLEDPHVTLAATFGVPLLRYSPRSSAARAFRRIARRIQGYYQPMKLR